LQQKTVIRQNNKSVVHHFITFFQFSNMNKLMLLALFSITAMNGYCQIGFGTNTPNSSLDVRGSIALNTRSITASSAAAITDEVIIFTGTAAATITLPDAATCNGRVYWIKNASTTVPVPVVTLSTSSGQTIGGFPGAQLDEPFEVTRIMSNGSNWVVANQNIAYRKSGAGPFAWYQGGNKIPSLKGIGTYTNYDMAFATNGLERMRINTSGFLGIGTNNPQGRLHFVNDNDDAGNDYIFEDYGITNTGGFFIRKSRGTVASPLDLQAGDLIAQMRFAPYFNGSVDRFNSGSGMDAYYQGSSTTNVSDMRFQTSGTERIRVGQNGNMGIGSSSFDGTNPEKLLVDAGTTGSYNVISGKGDIDNYLQLNIQNRSSGANASSDIVGTANNGTESVNYIDMGINGGGYSNTTLPILAVSDQPYLYTTGNDFVIGNSTAGSDLIFFTNGYATTNERLRITAAGNIGIGTSTPADKLSVAGIISPATDNTYTIGSSTNRWSAVWSANGVIQTSDLRLKTNIESLNYGTSQLMQLQPVRYQWKDKPNSEKKIGLIAQDVQKLIPEVVTGNEKTERLGMNYAEIAVVLINTIKAQQQKLRDLEKQLTELEKSAK
jgi:Chaperone of endosialidase